MFSWWDTWFPIQTQLVNGYIQVTSFKDVKRCWQHYFGKSLISKGIVEDEPFYLSKEEAHYLHSKHLYKHKVESTLKTKVFAYYRDKGWIVKSGLVYGCDFVLYKKGPSKDHSEYAVIVLDRLSDKSHLWLVLKQRVVNNANKKLLIVWLEKNELQEMVFDRWIPEQTRE